MRNRIRNFAVAAIVSLTSLLYAFPFNGNFTAKDADTLRQGNVLIKNIDYAKNMCLKNGEYEFADKLIADIKALSPRYLAEVMKLIPYGRNEDLPERLNDILNNVSDYAGIPYFSERSQAWYDLYSSAVITSEETKGNKKEMYADLEMEPFGTVNELIELYTDKTQILYIATNQNKLRYLDKFDCVWPKKMKMCILLFKEGDKWVLYGIGGVNAPRIPFFTERIETSFMNRIKTFCNFIFTKIG